MRSPLPWLGLALLVACGGRCGEPPIAAGDTQGTGSSGTTGVDAGATGPACRDRPDWSYDDCTAGCPGEGQCLSDGWTYEVCTQGCIEDCDCAASPGGGAPPRCSHEVIEGVGVCVLDCSGGASCPSGMWCVDALGTCAHGQVGGASSSSSGSGTGSSSGSSGGTTGAGSSSSDGAGTSSTGSSSSDGGSSGGTGGSSSSSGGPGPPDPPGPPG